MTTRILWLGSMLLCLVSGCGTVAGVALGQLLCGPGDRACRERLVAGGASVHVSVSHHGKPIDDALVFDCRTFDGRDFVFSDTPGNVGMTCMHEAGSPCVCSHFDFTHR